MKDTTPAAYKHLNMIMYKVPSTKYNQSAKHLNMYTETPWNKQIGIHLYMYRKRLTSRNFCLRILHHDIFENDKDFLLCVKNNMWYPAVQYTTIYTHNSADKIALDTPIKNSVLTV